MNMTSIPAASPQNDGLQRSARLMQALGARGGPIWSELSPEEASALSAAMEQLGPDMDEAGESLANAFLIDAASEPDASGLKLQSGLWRKLADLETVHLRTFLAGEPPQTIAMIVSCLDAAAAARLVRALTPAAALDVLRRLLKLGTPHPAALAAIEARLSGQMAMLTAGGGHERVARIFDRLDGRDEKTLLAALENAEPGAGARVRALMFTFDDLATLPAAGLQTLLAAADRASLVMALKGARPETEQAFFGNMTSRAGAFLREEIDGTGPVRRSDVDAARADLVTLARTLIQRGEIGAQESDEDELVE